MMILAVAIAQGSHTDELVYGYTYYAVVWYIRLDHFKATVLTAPEEIAMLQLSGLKRLMNYPKDCSLTVFLLVIYHQYKHAD